MHVIAWLDRTFQINVPVAIFNMPNNMTRPVYLWFCKKLSDSADDAPAREWLERLKFNEAWPQYGTPLSKEWPYHDCRVLAQSHSYAG
jgi:hypothetical protein